MPMETVKMVQKCTYQNLKGESFSSSVPFRCIKRYNFYNVYMSLQDLLDFEPFRVSYLKSVQSGARDGLNRQQPSHRNTAPSHAHCVNTVRGVRTFAELKQVFSKPRVSCYQYCLYPPGGGYRQHLSDHNPCWNVA